MKKRLKVLIILIAILLLIIGIIVFVVVKKNSNSNTEPQRIIEEIPDDLEAEEASLNHTVHYAPYRNEYYAVKSCIDNFFGYYMKDVDTGINGAVEVDNRDVMMAMLDKEYIDYRKITKENVTKKLDTINRMTIEINDMYVVQVHVNINVYFVYMTFYDKINNVTQDYVIEVKYDNLNKTFKVLLQDFVKEKYGNLKVGQELDFSDLQSIEKNQFNVFKFNNITDDQYLYDLFSNIKYDLMYNPKKAYESLDEEYEKKKFGSIENFKKFIRNNYASIMGMQAQGGQRTEEEGYTQYIISDSHDNYFIIKETTPMKYKLSLDSYTIYPQEFKDKYDSSNEQAKVALNIQNIIRAINQKDTKYVYSKLADSFKSNKFPTEDKFNRFINENLGSFYSVEFKKFRHEGNVYIYDIVLKDNKNQKTKKMQIIMTLFENRGYKISFSMQ